MIFHLICANNFGASNICPERVGKHVFILQNCISVTDDIKINELNKSITTEHIYIQTKFKMRILLMKVMAVLNTMVITDVVIVKIHFSIEA